MKSGHDLAGLSPDAIQKLGTVFGSRKEVIDAGCKRSETALRSPGSAPAEETKSATMPDPQVSESSEDMKPLFERVDRDRCLTLFTVDSDKTPGEHNDFVYSYSSFLHPIEFSKLRLFGERRSKIIWELVRTRYPIEEKGGFNEIADLTQRINRLGLKQANTGG